MLSFEAMNDDGGMPVIEYVPQPGDQAMMAVLVLGSEWDGEVPTGRYMVGLPNGEQTVAALGHLAPWISRDDLATIGRLVAAVHATIEAYPKGSVMQALRAAYEGTLSVRERLRGKAEGWA
jgi:hypothetical protein